MSRFVMGVVAWAAALALGFALVFTLGRPIANADQELDAALHPAPPVSQAAAEQSAETIVRLRYSELVDAQPAVTRRGDFGVDRWVITYSAGGDTLSGVTISVGIATGKVEVSSFP